MRILAESNVPFYHFSTGSRGQIAIGAEPINIDIDGRVTAKELAVLFKGALMEFAIDHNYAEDVSKD
ncbi:MAG: hypothetical protein AAF212_04475 [Verrucomicrobiota bacterium]